MTLDCEAWSHHLALAPDSCMELIIRVLLEYYFLEDMYLPSEFHYVYRNQIQRNFPPTIYSEDRILDILLQWIFFHLIGDVSISKYRTSLIGLSCRIPFYGYAIFCLTSAPVIEIWVVSHVHKYIYRINFQKWNLWIREYEICICILVVVAELQCMSILLLMNAWMNALSFGFPFSMALCSYLYSFFLFCE